MKIFIIVFFCAGTFGLRAQEHLIGIKGILGATNVTEIAFENKAILSPGYGITYDYS